MILNILYDSTWFVKPDLLSPVECAKYGWINIGEDWLKCEYCGECMLVKIVPDIELGITHFIYLFLK
jgi:hypothetical protein